MTEDTTKDDRDRDSSLPYLLPPLSSSIARANFGMHRVQQGGSGVNAITPVQQALRRLAARGYRIHSSAIWYIHNDDPENFQETLIANWDGTPQDAYDNLALHDWPTSPFLLCVSCGSGEAEFAGLCDFCNREAIEWVKVGEYM